MGGKEFVAFLDEIRYPKKVDTDSIDWMFDDNDNKDFMRWLCYEITAENLISPDEISRYEKLANSGGLILDNERLEETLANQKSQTLTFIDDQLYMDDNKKRVEAIKQHIEETERQIESVRARKKLLVKQREILEGQKLKSFVKYSQLEKTKKQIISDSQKKISDLKKNDQKHCEIVKSLLPALDNFGSYFVNFGDGIKSKSTGPKKLFLSQETFDRFYKQEAVYTKELANYARKLFLFNCPGSGKNELIKLAMDGIDGIDRSDSFQDGNVTNYSFHNENLELRANQQEEELLLMKEAISNVEMKFVRSLLKERETQATKEFLTQTINRLGSHSSSLFPATPDLMADLQLDRESETMLLEDAIEDLFAECIADQVERIGNSETVRILLRNYEKKYSVQKKMLESQAEIMKYLVMQRARNEFLSLAISTELKEHKNVSDILKTVFNFVNDDNAKSISRIDRLSGMLSTIGTQSPQMPITSRESFLHRLNLILSSSSPPSTERDRNGRLHLIMDDLQAASKLISQRVSNEKLRTKLLHSRAEGSSLMLMKQIADSLRLFPACLLRLSNEPEEERVTLGQRLLPSSIIEPMMELHDRVQSLEKEVGEILRDVDRRKQKLKSDDLLTRERMLYILFFTDVESFKREMKHIKQRALAHWP